MKKKTLFIHPGIIRTGTTYLQEFILNNIDNIEYLDKNHNQYFSFVNQNIFIPKYSNRQKLFFNTSERQIFIQAYSNFLLEIIESSKLEKFLVSNESIFDFINYDVDQNLSNLQDALNLLKDKINLEIKFFITTRDEQELIYSIFSHGYFRLKRKFKNIHSFINFFKNDKKIQEVLSGEIINKLKKISSNIKYLELNKFENNENFYKDIEDYFGAEVNKNFQNKNVNSNSEIVNNEKRFYMRDLKFIYQIKDLLAYFLRELNPKFLRKILIFKKLKKYEKLDKKLKYKKTKKFLSDEKLIDRYFYNNYITLRSN